MSYTETIERKYCCLCEKEVESFLPYRIGQQPFTNELNLIGSDVSNFYCPNCGCHDRERHLWLFINEIGLYDAVNNDHILYFAPEKRLLEKFLLKSKNIIVGDVNPDKYSDRCLTVQNINIENIPYENETFDLVIANHVLEHVDDYLKAMNEIKRVLKNGGNAILQTPFSPAIYNNIEDPLIDTDELRLKYYGQEDHLRVFGLRFFDDLISVGFKTYRLSHEQILKQYDSKRYGVNQLEDLIFVSKQQAEI